MVTLLDALQEYIPTIHAQIHAQIHAHWDISNEAIAHRRARGRIDSWNSHEYVSRRYVGNDIFMCCLIAPISTKSEPTLEPGFYHYHVVKLGKIVGEFGFRYNKDGSNTIKYVRGGIYTEALTIGVQRFVNYITKN